MNRMLGATFMAMVCFGSVSHAAFSSLQRSTITASVTFESTSTIKVNFAHTALTGVPGNFVTIFGTATSINANLASVSIDYYQTGTSTSTISNSTGNVNSFFFTSTAAVNKTIQPATFYYRIRGLAGDTTGYWPAGGGYQSVNITKSVSVSHTAITDIAGSTATIGGSVTSQNAYLNYVYVDHYQTGTSTVTETMAVSGQQLNVNFSTAVLINRNIGSDFFYYRMRALADGTTGFWPVGQGYYSVNISQKEGLALYHDSIKRISSVRLVAVATGTATSPSGLKTVSMYYWTDKKVSKSTNTVSVPGNAVSYNFEFSLSLDKGINTFYYFIKAIDSITNVIQTSTYTVSVNSAVSYSFGPPGGIVTLENGDQTKGGTSITIPEGALAEFHNIAITELSRSDVSVPLGNDNSRAISPHRFDPDGLFFAKNSLITLSYDPNSPKLLEGQEDNLRIFWWDGFTWRLIGGTVNKDKKTVTANIRHFSLYALFITGALTDDDYRPKEKIITPATIDGINDFAAFGNIVDGNEVMIYDVNGNKVRKISDTNIWDGKDDGGDIVESGIYIYQIKVSGKLISGTVVVAK